MDLLAFDGDELYFDEPLNEEVAELLRKGAESYGSGDAQGHLMRAYFLAPEHPMVLVALYRFFYYRHAYASAYEIAERTLAIVAGRLGLPDDWRRISTDHVKRIGRRSVGMLRFYLLALKGAGYLLLRLGQKKRGLERLRKVRDLDEADRLGAGTLIETVCAASEPPVEVEDIRHV